VAPPHLPRAAASCAPPHLARAAAPRERLLTPPPSDAVAPAANARQTAARHEQPPAGTELRADHARIHRVETILSVVQVALSITLIFLVLMHSGKDAGLSGAFGVGTGAGPFGGGSLVERNLNRWTIAFAIAWVLNTLILLKI
jgi:preprotein translocase subunit SecG